MCLKLIKDTLYNNVLCLYNVTEIDIHNRPVDINIQSSSLCLAPLLARIYFIKFVLISEYVLINIVVAVLLKHLEVYLFLIIYS